MLSYNINKNSLDEESIRYFTKVNKDRKLVPTGDTLTISSDMHGGESSTLVIFKGTWTPYGYVRDCGDHLIHATHSAYDRIDKETMEVTHDVEDR